MKTLTNIILIIFAVILQISLIPKLAIYGGYPNLILVVMLSLLFIGKKQESLWWLGLGGIFLELVSPFGFGFFIFPLLVVFFLGNLITQRIFSDPVITISLGLFFVASIFMDFSWIITSGFFSSDQSNWLIVLFDSIYNTFVGCIVYVLIRYYLMPRESIKI